MLSLMLQLTLQALRATDVQSGVASDVVSDVCNDGISDVTGGTWLARTRLCVNDCVHVNRYMSCACACPFTNLQ